MSTRIWYNRFKDEWLNALPLGNGRLAAMFYGNPQREQLQLNEESLWTGRPLEEQYETSPEIMDTVRTHLFNEEYEAASQLSTQYFLANPSRVRTYQTAGDLWIDFADKTEVQNYIKELELKHGIARCSYDKGQTHYESECFISKQYDCICYKIKTTGGEPFSFDASLTRNRIPDPEKDVDTQKLTVTNTPQGMVLSGCLVSYDDAAYGSGGEDMRFGLAMTVKTDGEITSQNQIVSVKNAREAVIVIDIETDYDVSRFDFDRSKDIDAAINAALQKATQADYDAIKAAHVRDFAASFKSADLDLGSPCDDIPTDERLHRVQNGEEDADLYALYFHYGRYLLLSSSGGNATLPANLQGKWCRDFAPPWGSDYHTNINLQMNYWPAHLTNLCETTKPLIHFVKMLAQSGQKTAARMYHAGGWVVHHTTDIFGRTGLHDGAEWGFFPMAGPWLCLNLWEEYEFTQNRAFLELTLYPILKGACVFLKDFLIRSPEGYWVTNPSNSPENSFWYIDKNGEKKQTRLTYGATMDFEIIRSVFTRMIYAAALLKKDGDFAEELRQILTQLPPLTVSKRYGALCEWIKDYEEVEPQHRHISHMFALYPDDGINESTPELFEAAKKTVERRLAHGGGATGWSRAWIVNFYARLKDGENALKHLKQLLVSSTAENLFDMHPPFQIDGNFGGCAGIGEMLLQSQEGKPDERTIVLLPALPKSWLNGSFRGLCARGNFVVDVTWQNGAPVYIKILAQTGGMCRVKYNGRMLYEQIMQPGETWIQEF